jgi:hypothetical protein
MKMLTYLIAIKYTNKSSLKKENAASFSHTMLPIELTPQPHVYVYMCGVGT